MTEPHLSGRAIGGRIRDERKRLGWSQQQLAIQAGVDRNWIASVEAGNTDDPGAARVLAVARAMGIDLWYLLTGERREGEHEGAGIVRRLLDRYTPDQLTRFERALAALYVDVDDTPEPPGHDGNGNGEGDGPDTEPDSLNG